MLRTENCPTSSPPTSSKSLPRSSAAAPPARYPRCWQWLWGRDQARLLRDSSQLRQRPPSRQVLEWQQVHHPHRLACAVLRSPVFGARPSESAANSPRPPRSTRSVLNLFSRPSLVCLLQQIRSVAVPRPRQQPGPRTEVRTCSYWKLHPPAWTVCLLQRFLDILPSPAPA